ncbi:WhiB family transcriptional regulator [Streptomyces sp. NPDC096132]|uniref:WhiB family transcriptional regulator n=1 Tax=Streptomyces sp. NPDC096132 TaxID=3366075 RepID=UPI0037F4E0FB
MKSFPSVNWREAAACRYEDPELFFPIGEGGLSRRQIEQARAVCHRCPVMRACGAWAVRHNESDGVWGAMTAGERRSLRLSRPPRGGP